MPYAELDKQRAFFHEHAHLLPQEIVSRYESAFRVEYTHNSTAIEGNTLSLMETKLLVEDNVSVGGKALREIYEVTNHAKAFAYAQKSIREGKPLDETMVKDLHQLLMENIQPGGIYRNVNVRISGARFQPPEPNEMYTQVKGFFAQLPFPSHPHSIEHAAWVHAEFVRIHPFSDGNGRISRLMMNYALMSDGWLPISIAKEDRLSYFEALEAYALGEGISAFATYVAALESRELDRRIELIHQVGL